MKQAEIRQFLGLPRNASPEEIERRCNALLEWLGSESVPEGVRPWAAARRALIQEIAEGLGITEGEATDEEEDDDAEEPVAPAARPRAFARRRRRPLLRRLLESPLSLAALGVFVGMIVLGGLWWRGIIFSKEETVNPPSSEQESFDPQQYLAAQQQRIRELESTLAANPKDTAALFEIAETYIVGESWENAILWFTKLLEVDPSNSPDSIHARIDIGTANMSLKKYAEAEAAFTQVLAIDPANAQTHYNMGFLMAFRSDAPNLAGAVKHWQEVIRVAPGTELAQIAQVHLDQMQQPKGTP
ncbi:MAG: tetratricopeptide repeat protein [Chloroflexi bacterium]|nr:tetratricopeptide repeat protein [Chloroflexota bacterium]